MTSGIANGEPPTSGAPLVLLFGLPRSGTTWAGKIFDSHPDTLYRHEPDSWSALAAIPLVAAREEAARHRETVRRFVRGLPGRRETKVAGSTPVFPKRYLAGWQQAWLRAGVLAAKGVARLRGECRVPPVPGASDLRSAPVVWKSIESIGRMGLLADVLPQARGVLLVRHPCGFIASVLRGERSRRFTSGTPASEDYGVLESLLTTHGARRRGLSLAYLRTLTPAERLAWRWLLFNEKAMEEVAADGRFAVVRYEDLCRDPEATAGAMFQRVGLALDPQTREFLAASTRSDRGGYFSVYKDSARAAEHWRHELDAETAERVREVVTGTLPGALYDDH